MYRYLASPYSHSSSVVRQLRFRAAELAVVNLLRNKQWVYSPIVHCHALAVEHGLPKDFEFWREYNRMMLGPAGQLVVLTLPGWEESVGVREELRIAAEFLVSTYYIEPVEDEVLEALRQLA